MSVNLVESFLGYFFIFIGRRKSVFMDIEEMLHKLHQVLKIPDDEIMVLPFEKSNPNEVKVYYGKIRNMHKNW